MEDWKLIIDYNDYWVSDHGRIFSYRKCATKGRILKPGKRNSEGHLSVHLINDDGRRSFYVHELVLIHFDCPRPDSLVCGHKDDDVTNNHISNLHWITVAENTQRSIDLGRHISVTRPTIANAIN